MRRTIRGRLGKALEANGIDAYIAVTPSSFRYVTGHNSAFLDLSWQMTGTDMAVVFADTSIEPAIVVSDYSASDVRRDSDITDIRTYSMWTENRSLDALTELPPRYVLRPEQYDTEAIFALVASIFSDRKIGRAVVGTDLAQMKSTTKYAMIAGLPDCRIVDCEDIVYGVRAVKEPFEIESLAAAAGIFDTATDATFQNVELGQTEHDLRRIFEAEAHRASEDCETTFFFPHLGTDGVVTGNAIVKLDTGARVNGYWSDGCRHRVFGDPTPTQRRIHDALSAGYEEAFRRIKPGACMRDIFDAGVTAVREHGLPGYSRGHIGHSIGLDGQIEEPPFIGPNDATLQENMVICLELPCYPPEIGGFNLEDMILVTHGGAQVLTRLSHRLAL